MSSVGCQSQIKETVSRKWLHWDIPWRFLMLLPRAFQLRRICKYRVTFLLCFVWGATPQTNVLLFRKRLHWDTWPHYVFFYSLVKSFPTMPYLPKSEHFCFMHCVRRLFRNKCAFSSEIVVLGHMVLFRFLIHLPRAFQRCLICQYRALLAMRCIGRKSPNKWAFISLLKLFNWGWSYHYVFILLARAFHHMPKSEKFVLCAL